VRASLLFLKCGTVLGLLGSQALVFTGCAAPFAAPQRITPVALGTASDGRVRQSIDFAFTTLDDQADPTFNRLLGINNEGKIGGYYGSGAPGSPNRGYVVTPPYQQANFKHQDYPSGIQTEVTSVNNKHTIAGFYVDEKGKIFGFTQSHGIWYTYADRHGRHGRGTVTEILGLGDQGIGVGFYVAASGLNEAFTIDEATGKFAPIRPPGSDNAIASGIDGRGDIAGYFTRHSRNIVSFLLRHGRYTRLAFPARRTRRRWELRCTTKSSGRTSMEGERRTAFC
jgi:hypothetical protein